MSGPNAHPHGLRVIGASADLPGPNACPMPADTGADAVEVEPPRGDGTRPLGPRDPDGGAVPDTRAETEATG